MFSVEHYINAREKGISMQEIAVMFQLSEATAYCFEFGYQCYLKQTPLDVALTKVTA